MVSMVPKVFTHDFNSAKVSGIMKFRKGIYIPKEDHELLWKGNCCKSEHLYLDPLRKWGTGLWKEGQQ